MTCFVVENKWKIFFLKIKKMRRVVETQEKLYFFFPSSFSSCFYSWCEFFILRDFPSLLQVLNSPSEPSSFGEALTTKKTLVASSNTSLDRSVGILDILPFWVLMLLPKRLYKRRFLFTACICKFFFFQKGHIFSVRQAHGPLYVAEPN